MAKLSGQSISPSNMSYAARELLASMLVQVFAFLILGSWYAQPEDKTPPKNPAHEVAKEGPTTARYPAHLT